MPSIKLTDQVGVDVEVELKENSAIAKYLKDLSKLKLSKLQFEDLKNIPLDQVPLKTLETGITFEQPIGLGVDDTELTIAAGVSGGLKLLSAKDKQLFDTEVFGDPITIRDDQIYVGAQATAKVSSELTNKSGDLSFGFTAGSQVSLASYRLFERTGNGAFPSCLNAVKETIGAFVIPGDLQDLVLMDRGTVATVEGSGTIKFSGGMNLLTVVNPLVAADLPDPIGTLKLASGGAIKIGASFEIEGAYQLRVHKVSEEKAHLGYYKKKGTEFGVKASASVGLSGGIGDFDSIEMVLKAISSDPKVDAEELKKGGLTDAQVESIKKVVEAGISRKLELAAAFELSSQGTSEAAFLFEVEFAKLNEVGRAAVHQALDGDLTRLAVASSDLPPGISLVRSIFTEVQKEKHTVKLNLLGIYNFISVSTLILKGTVMFEPRTGEIIITDKATASRIAASMFNFAADAEKLRKVLAESVLITAAYRCSKLVTHQPELQIVHSYIEMHSKTNQTVMKDNLDVFESLGLMTKSEKEQLVGLASQFGRTMFYAETSYDDRLVNDLFLKNGAPRRSEEYEEAGRQALALLVQSGEAEQFRRLPARDDSLWQEMKLVGQPSFRFIEKLKVLSATQLGAVTSDYSVIVWWAEAMEEMSKNLAAIRQFLAANPTTDPENNTFKSLRKKLASKLREVASTTKSEFGDPWGLLAMDQCSGGKAAAKALITSPQLSIFRQR
ncbi:MAG: hypothetical protein ND895_04070 [Pyrinomonadaceae bacterium]|nr:hypothetical protein [Pyrinomonadaceae bacterium]